MNQGVGPGGDCSISLSLSLAPPPSHSLSLSVSLLLSLSPPPPPLCLSLSLSLSDRYVWGSVGCGFILQTSAEVVYMKLCRKQLSVLRGGGWFKVSCINSAALFAALSVQSPCSTGCIDLQRLPGKTVCFFTDGHEWNADSSPVYTWQDACLCRVRERFGTIWNFNTNWCLVENVFFWDFSHRCTFRLLTPVYL